MLAQEPVSRRKVRAVERVGGEGHTSGTVPVCLIVSWGVVKLSACYFLGAVCLSEELGLAEIIGSASLHVA